MLKAPFVTNRNRFHHYVDDWNEILHMLAKIQHDMFVKKDCFVVPYIMLQERVDNREIKMVFLNGTYSHMITCSTGKIVKSFSGYSENDIISFGESVLSIIAATGLVRVDIFKLSDGKLVVNELESLEARFFSTEEERVSKCCHFLESYWEKKLYEHLSLLK